VNDPQKWVFSYLFCRTMPLMTRDEIIKKLKAREADLRAQGVAHAAVFGSIARGEDHPDSDIDILVDLDPTIVVTIVDYAGVKDFIADMFDRPVDVVSRESLKPRVRPKATADAIYAF
jgi:predicted nucleotidyltransferase